MNMNWDSTEQIAIFFDFPEATHNDPVALRLAITRKMASVHPDNNQGDFEDIKTETLWNQLHSAKAFLDVRGKTGIGDQTNTQMIPLSQVTELVKVITEAGRPSLEASVSALKAEARSDARSDVTVPRISSGAIATICGFLFAFPNTVKDNPIFGHLLKYTEVQLFLFIMSFMFAMIFVMTWSNEKWQEQKVGFLSTEEGLKHTLSALNHQNNNSRQFTHSNLTQAINPTSRYGHFVSHEIMTSFMFGSKRLSMSLTDKIATLQLDKLKQRGVIIELPQAGLERTYEFSESAFRGFTGAKEQNS